MFHRHGTSEHSNTKAFDASEDDDSAETQPQIALSRVSMSERVVRVSPDITKVNIRSVRVVLEVRISMKSLSARIVHSVSATVLIVAVRRVNKDSDDSTNISR